MSVARSSRGRRRAVGAPVQLLCSLASSTSIIGHDVAGDWSNTGIDRPGARNLLPARPTRSAVGQPDRVAERAIRWVRVALGENVMMVPVTLPAAFANRVSRDLGVEIPIVQAPMGWIARSQLASAVS